MSTVIKKIKVGETLYDIIDTDTTVTEVGKHYTPKADETAEISVDASSTSSANWNVTSLVTGVNIQRDKAGHVTGVTLDSVKMPSNPNTDANCSESGHYTPKTEKTENKQSAKNGEYISAIKLDSKKHVVGIDTSSLPTFAESYKGTVTSITPGVGLKLNGKDDGDSTPITSSGTIDLQKASDTELGGIKTGYIGTGKNYAVKLDTSDAAYVNVPWSDTNTHHISKNIVAASTRSTSNGAVTDNGVYLNHLEESTIKSTHKITGSGSVKVTSDASGNITITGTDTNTTYSVVSTNGTTGLIKNGSTVTSSSGYTPCPIVSGVPYYKDTNTTYSVVGANGSTGLIKNGSTVTSSSGYTACPIVSGVPYYKDTNTTYTAGTNITISNGEISASYPVVSTNGTTGLIKNGSTVTSSSGYTACPIVSGVPYYKDTNTHYTSKNIIGTSATASSNGAVTDNGVYLNHLEESNIKSTHKITGSGSVKVTSDASGNITITGTDTNTTYSVVGANGSTGLIKNGSSVTSTSGYTTCPIVNGVPYYKDTNTTYTAGANITISGTTISAKDTTYTAGTNITISGTTISAKDTTYTAGANITISGTVISAKDTTYSVVSTNGTTGLIKNGSTVTSSTGYTACPIVGGVPYYKDTNTTYTAGTNITISDGVISAKDTTYTAGTNITISGTTISAKDTTYTAGTNITISGGVISAIDTTYSVVGANGSTGLIKNGSTVTSSTGYTACPIVGGVPYYKDTNTTYSVVSTNGTTGLIKNGSTVTSSSGYTPCPIVSGVPYYKANTAGATTTSSKIYLIGTLSSGTNPQTYTNLSVHATNGELTAKSYIVTGSSSSTNKITSDAPYNMYFSIGGKTPLVLANDDSSNMFVAPGSKYSTQFDLGTNTRQWKNVYASGQMYAIGGFYETSDETLKNFSNPINIDLDKLSNIKKNYFTWKKSENKEQQIGVSAQEIRELYPEIVSEQEDGILTVAYDKLSVIALAAIDKLYQENKDLKERLIALENKLK